MDPHLQFLLACLGLSLLITYAWWMRFRVWFLRQDLFAIRDALWDDLLEAGALDDPEHRRFREGVNSLIRIAPLLSLVTVLKILLDRDEVRSLLTTAPAHPRVQRARIEVAARVVTYLLFGSASGLLLMLLGLILGLAQSIKDGLSRRILALMDARAFVDLDRVISRVTSEHVTSAGGRF